MVDHAYLLKETRSLMMISLFKILAEIVQVKGILINELCDFFRCTGLEIRLLSPMLSPRVC